MRILQTFRQGSKVKHRHVASLGRYEESLSLYKQILPEDKANYNLSILQKSRENSNTSSQIQLDNMDMMQSDTQTTIDEEK